MNSFIFFSFELNFFRSSSEERVLESPAETTDTIRRVSSHEDFNSEKHLHILSQLGQDMGHGVVSFLNKYINIYNILCINSNCISRIQVILFIEMRKSSFARKDKCFTYIQENSTNFFTL